jgi:adenylate cyclase
VLTLTSTATTLTGAIAFTDIVGFTEFTAEHGDGHALALVERHEEITGQTLPVGARIVKQLGDGLLLFFPDAGGAFDACREMQTRFGPETVDDYPLWVRIGLHWGAPRVRGEDLIGHDVNLASRVAGLAAPGELLLTDAFVAALGSAVGCEELGPMWVKGIAEPVNVWRVGV